LKRFSCNSNIRPNYQDKYLSKFIQLNYFSKKSLKRHQI
jgi:hypothetical protein